MGWTVTDGNLSAMLSWMNAEGTRAGFNPLATTQPWENTTGFNFRTDGVAHVKNYATFDDGIAATVQTLGYSFYNSIRGAFARGTNSVEMGHLVGASKWGTQDFSGRAGDNGETLLGMAGNSIADGVEEGRNPDGTNSDFDLDAAIRDLWPDGNVPLDVQWIQLPPELQQEIMSTMGYITAYLQNPEIGPILIRAGLLEMDDEKIKNLLRNTEWWKNTDVKRRAWKELTAIDPGEAERQREQKRATVVDAASRTGASLSEIKIMELVEESLFLGWDGNQLVDAIVGESQYRPGQEAPMGDLRTVNDNIKTMASRYMLSYSDEVRDQFSRRIAKGELEEEDIRSLMVEDAKGRYSYFANQLDQGYTIEQLMDTRQNEVSRILGIDPQEVDFRDNPKFQQILEHPDPVTGESRAMNMMETRQYIGSLPEYEQTSDSHVRASKLSTNLLRKFGAI